MTKALDDALRAAQEQYDDHGIDDDDVAVLAVLAALCAALPAEPEEEAIAAMAQDMTFDDPSWIPGEAEAMARRAYLALRVHLLGDDA